MNEDRRVSQEEKREIDFKVAGWGFRHQQCVILFFALTIAYSMRALMGVSLVAMTDYHVAIITVNDKNHTYNGAVVDDKGVEFISDGFFNALLLVPPYPQFKWNKKTQDTLISSFFWGYMLLQIPAGQLAHRFGARYLLTGALGVNCIISITLPLGAYYGGWICTVIMRVVQGLTQACIVPGMHTFFGKWAPLEERGRLTGLTYGGQALGTVLGLPMTGFISTSVLGWPGIFRFYGILSGIIAVVIWFMLADTPSKHPKISIAERRYIEEGMGQKQGYEKKTLPVPWSKILRNPGMFAIVCAHISNTWGQLVLYSEVPAFMDKVMGVNIKANGLLTALPFLVMWGTNFFFSWLTDMIIINKYMTVTNTRKFATTLGYVPAALGLIVLAYVPKNIYVVEIVLVIICAFKISSHLGFQVNHIDISPNFAGTMMSISNFASNLVASLAPIVTGFILTDVKSEYLWRQVFFVTAGFYLTSNLVYVIFGTAEKAEWNDPPESNEKETERLMIEKSQDNK
ncbi:hypothetical protein K1T71_008064 [Dendrolimus kikuchii]|uniref:Uncharacterized protein n=1 Tax=Dendrolimus kikuchii TaxID=765133 RepID=A0ACC1CZH1_9NEOP|nr:hypothetical protein K1T71_008064 [Dendrolimus kikuchii]